ncbi:ribosomal RNA-processing protein 1 [Trichomonascus vanleenenianus]|uniref:Rrp1p n=1 Tax=Trichomonascus vanleenenianus TaxID=2268995 RepID=UPI003ECA8E08
MPKAEKSKPETYSFIKKLAANDRPSRDEALESLTKFLTTKRKFDSLEFQKLWIGLYYCMWHSDRPRTQQRLADDLAGLLLVVHEVNFKTFYDAFWTVMNREFDKIDKHRVDKFYLLVRRYVAAALRRLKKESWDSQWVQDYNEIMTKIPLNPSDLRVSNGLRLHMFDIYMDEIDRVLHEDGEEEVDYAAVPIEELIKPMREMAEKHKLKHIRQNAEKYVLEDARLIQWGVVEPSSDSEDYDSDDEWGGFD